METKLNDSCPLGRELETDELKNVSGGDMAVLRDDELDAVTSGQVGKTLAGKAKIVDGRFMVAVGSLILRP
jgi:hypothetical protein